ncbi:MAG: hypothetical protein VZS12_10780 [Ruminococcus bromii]|nr:hypothetical protein [Ruminococcus bromii]
MNDITENDVVSFISDSADIIAKMQARQISTAFVSAQNAGSLTNNVEFWKWLSKNYNCLSDAQAIQSIANGTVNQQQWLQRTVLQGKGYEWDFMTAQRDSIKNLFSKFDAGTSATQPGYDIVETEIFSGKVLNKYQNKAYTSGTTPHLDNTAKDIKVVTNKENIPKVQEMGYDTVPYQDNSKISSQTDKRMKQAKSGKANTSYTFKGVAGTMAKAGVAAAVIGMGIESLASYKRFKCGAITKEQYIKEILKSGASTGITGTATAGIMIPVSAAVTATGIAQPWLIPVSFVISAALDKIVSPCFGRGNYQKQLGQAKYYQNLSDMQIPLIEAIEESAGQLECFINTINSQRQQFAEKTYVNSQLNKLQRRGNEVLSNKSEIDELNTLISKI